MEPDEAAYDLVMPFLPVTSNGGPHDDDAYTAGYEMGGLDATLKSGGGVEYQAIIRTENAKQADLIAMQHGYQCETTPTEYPEWTHACFTSALDPEKGI